VCSRFTPTCGDSGEADTSIVIRQHHANILIIQISSATIYVGIADLQLTLPSKVPGHHVSTTMSTTTTTTAQPAITLHGGASAKQAREPLLPSGVLDRFKHEESTPVIGREYVDLNLVNDIINAENADELIRDLAITSMLPVNYLRIRQLTFRSLSAWCRLLPSTRQSHRRHTKGAGPASG